MLFSSQAEGDAGGIGPAQPVQRAGGSRLDASKQAAKPTCGRFLRAGWSLGPPAFGALSDCSFFGWEGFPSKIDYRKRVPLFQPSTEGPRSRIRGLDVRGLLSHLVSKGYWGSSPKPIQTANEGVAEWVLALLVWNLKGRTV